MVLLGRIIGSLVSDTKSEYSSRPLHLVSHAVWPTIGRHTEKTLRELYQDLF